MGSAWYEGGKLLNKVNTFHDFIACADFLIKVTSTKAVPICVCLLIQCNVLWCAMLRKSTRARISSPCMASPRVVWRSVPY